MVYQKNGFEFRPYKEEEADEFQSLMSYVFASKASEDQS